MSRNHGRHALGILPLALLVAGVAGVAAPADPKSAPEGGGQVQITGGAPAPVPSPAPIRIMPLGDSITAGTGGGPATSFSGYRGPLQARLAAQGVVFDFVGPSAAGAASIDPDHAGFPGWRIDEIKARVGGWVREADPDVVLLHIGTYDMLQAFDVGGASGRLAMLIDAIREASPGVRIVVATLIPSADVAIQARIDRYNTGVRSAVTAQAIAHGDVTLVDMSAALVPRVGGDLSDVVHPSDDGYAKMAAVWDDGFDGIVARAGRSATAVIRGPAPRELELGVLGARMPSASGRIGAWTGSRSLCSAPSRSGTSASFVSGLPTCLVSSSR